MRRFLLIVIISVLFSTAVWADSWLKVACHSGHTDYSDGERTFAELVTKAKNSGYSVIIVNDHLEQIAEKPNGFEKYLADCAKKYAGITIIPGIEVMTEKIGIGKSHTIVFGYLTVESLEELNMTKSILDIVRVAKKYDLITVSAHPFDSLNPYDRDSAFEINGHEFFNDKGYGYGKNLDWLMQRQTKGWQGFVWAGMDSHYKVDPGEIERWNRQTWVYTKSTSVNDLLTAFRADQTYASSTGIQLENLNLIPGKVAQKVKAHLTFTVSCAKIIAGSSHRIRIYRDEKLVDTQWLYQGKTAKTIDFVDKDCPSGIHRYNIEVEQGLVTSAIILDVSKPEIVAKPINYTGGAPILIGKTRAEVVKLWGNDMTAFRTNETPIFYSKDQDPNYHYPKWEYNIGHPFKPFSTLLYFTPYNTDNHRDRKKDPIYNTVQWSVYRQGTLSRHRGIFVKQLVPAQILNQPPTEICRMGCYHKDELLVIWRIGGNTFLLGVRDSRRALFDATEIIEDGHRTSRYKYKLNSNSNDFRNANDAFLFIQITGTPQFYGRKEYWEQEISFEGSPIKYRGDISGIGYFYRFFD